MAAEAIIQPPTINNTNIVINSDKNVLHHVVTNENRHYGIRIFQSHLVLVANILIGATVGISVIFAFVWTEFPNLDATSRHIVTCCIGYQLLMAQATLALTSDGSWAAKYTLVDQRRVHWILQTVGSGLAIYGTIDIMIDKPPGRNFETPHGIYGFVAMVFTVISLINGLTSLYAFELRRYIPGILSKLSHIAFGSIAFVTSSISLAYSFPYYFFITCATVPIAYTLIVFTAIFTFIVIINPVITFYTKTVGAFRN